MSEAVYRDFWHPVAAADAVTTSPVPVTLLDERLVVARLGGRPVVFRDLCIHRGTPLSLGWVDGEELVCAYHGWAYNAEGVCIRIPSLGADRSIPRRARVDAYPAVEQYGLIWTCLGTPRGRSILCPSSGMRTSCGTDGSTGPRLRAICRNGSGGSTGPFTIHLMQRSEDGERGKLFFFTATPHTSKSHTNYLWVLENVRLTAEQLAMERKMGETIMGQDQRIVEEQRPEELPVDLSEELHVKGPDAIAIEYRRFMAELGVAA